MAEKNKVEDAEPSETPRQRSERLRLHREFEEETKRKFPHLFRDSDNPVRRSPGDFEENWYNNIEKRR